MSDKGPEYLNPYCTAHGAALGLQRGLKRMAEIEAAAEGYDYGLPYGLESDRDATARQVRDAVRFLCSDEAS